MADLVIMPKVDWQDILDATREKTGKTDLLLSDAVSTEIRSIAGEDLTEELAEQEKLIAQLQTAVEGKSGQQTCNVTITGVTQDLIIYYTDGVEKSNEVTTLYETSPSITIPAIKNSYVVINCTSLGKISYEGGVRTGPIWFSPANIVIVVATDDGSVTFS